MTIILKNKATLLFDDFIFKCSIGKNGNLVYPKTILNVGQKVLHQLIQSIRKLLIFLKFAIKDVM